MPRYTIVYPSDGGPSYYKGSDEPEYKRYGPVVIPDAPDFVSPIDGTVVRGRAGIRDHCVRHNVVPTLDLKGLPTKRPVGDDKRARLEDIKRAMITKGLL
jgi:hypothetical protein